MTTPQQKRHPMSWVPTLYMAEGLPFYAVALISGLMYKSLGVANDQIAYWTALIGLAWVFKCLWSPFLELASSKKAMIILTQFIGGICLVLVGLALKLPAYFTISLILLGLVAVASATHDIVADGLYIASLSNKQQAEYAGWQGAFYNLSKMLTLGGLVWLAGYLERQVGASTSWTIIFLIMGVILIALGLYHSWALPDIKRTSERQSVAAVSQTLKEVIIDFFKKPGIWMAIAFIILFRAAEGQIQTIGPLFLKEAREAGGLGLTNEQIGIAYGTAGSLAFLGGSILGGYFTSWLGLRRAMLWLILAMNVPNLVFYFLSQAQPDNFYVILTAISFEMAGYGFGIVGLTLFVMQVVAPGKFQTAHYALGTGVWQLGFVFFKSISGTAQLNLGYKNFFIWVVLCAIPVLILSHFIDYKDQDATTEPAKDSGINESASTQDIKAATPAS